MSSSKKNQTISLQRWPPSGLTFLKGLWFYNGQKYVYLYLFVNLIPLFMTVIILLQPQLCFVSHHFLVIDLLLFRLQYPSPHSLIFPLFPASWLWPSSESARWHTRPLEFIKGRVTLEPQSQHVTRDVNSPSCLPRTSPSRDWHTKMKARRAGEQRKTDILLTPFLLMEADRKTSFDDDSNDYQQAIVQLKGISVHTSIQAARGHLAQNVLRCRLCGAQSQTAGFACFNQY